LELEAYFGPPTRTEFQVKCNWMSPLDINIVIFAEIGEPKIKVAAAFLKLCVISIQYLTELSC